MSPRRRDETITTRERETVTELSSWLNIVSAELGITDVELDNNDIHTLLDLARDSAHEVERLAAPLTSYLVGVAVGRGASLGSAAAKVTALALSNGSGPPSDAAEPTGGTPDSA
jgi:hypothetical protein